MSVADTIARLEGLLGRIQRNAALPRDAERSTVPTVLPEAPEPRRVAAAPAAPPVAAVEEAPLLEMDELDMRDTDVAELTRSGVPASGKEELELEEVEMEELDVGQASGTRASEPPLVEADEPPLKTPPPESGRQVMTPPPPDYEDVEEADIGGADVEDLLQPDLSGGPISRAPAAGGPTMEQLGEVVELAGADAPDAHLELAMPLVEDSPSRSGDALELELPRQGFSGAYDPALAPPPEAAAELVRHRAAAEERTRTEERAHAAALRAPAPPPAGAVPVGVSPVVVARPPAAGEPAVIIPRPPAPLPTTFLDLLDRSLGL